MIRTISLILLAAAGCFGQARYEMDNYIVGLLRRPPNAPTISAEQGKQIQEAHMAHIRRMGESGKLIVAGPFTHDGQLRGMFIFKTTMEEAKALTADDPAVKAGRLVFELYPWFAAKGLSVAPPVSK
jgi:uncharacterized protein YciI